MNETLIKSTALRTLDVEQKALVTLQGSIDEQFVSAIELIGKSEGRLIVTGIGKSALVAQKIVATFNSTGTPSLFLHAADAIHGDLGMITGKDIIMCISKSGNTPEVKVLIPLIKNLGNPVIAVTANDSSFLAKKASFVLLTPIDEEGDPNNLAPMTSTTCQMALGDAMASSLLAIKGFSTSQFAMLHPGGTLGKQLYLKVADLINQDEIPIVKDSDNLNLCIIEMTSKRIGATAVVNKNDELVGIITDGDLRRMLSQGGDLTHITAAEIMTKDPISIDPDIMAVEALNILKEKSISQVIVAKEKKVLGFVHFHDLLKEGLV